LLAVVITGEHILDVEDLVVEYASGSQCSAAVDQVSFHVSEGERLALVGESGCGKTSLALSLLGMLEPPGRVSAGRIVFCGVRLDLGRRRDLTLVRGRGIGMIFQDGSSSLNPVLTIGRQLMQAITLHAPGRASAAKELAVAALRDVEISMPERRMRQYPHELSSGMRQRVMIALMLACTPRLLIADEPTTALDVTTQAAVLDLLIRLSRDRSMALMLITHDMGIVTRFADNVMVMYRGVAVEYGPITEVLRRPKHPYTKSLMAAVPRITDERGARLVTIPGAIPGSTEQLAGCPFQPRCFLGNGRQRCMSDRPSLEIAPRSRVACHFWAEAVGVTPPAMALTPRRVEQRPVRAPSVRLSDGEERPLLEARGLSKSFAGTSVMTCRGGAVRAVDGVDVLVRRGESLGVIGESGSGKTTLARILVGLQRPDAGRVLFNGTALTPTLSGWRNSERGKLNLVFQDSLDSLDPTMTIRASIAEPLALLGSVGRTEARQRVEQVMAIVDLSSTLGERTPRQLSGGELQRAAIARALVTYPELIVCDEPVSSLDVSVRAQVLNLLMDLQRNLAVSYLFISHDVSVVRHVCDTVAIMYAGRFVECGDAADIFSAPQHPYTIELLSAVPSLDTVAERVSPVVRPLREVPDEGIPSEGCVLRPRCWKAQDLCRDVAPPLISHDPADGLTVGRGAPHLSACHFPEHAGPVG
jgi:peptide/nickel transport system ATP-binding protein